MDASNDTRSSNPSTPKSNNFWQGMAVLLSIAASAGFAGWYLSSKVFAPREIHIPANETVLKVGDQSIDLRLPDLNGHPQALSQWTGKPILLNFWASWCGPCRKEMPLLNAFQQQHREQLQIIGIALEPLEPARQAATEMAIEFPVLVDEATGFDSSNRFGNTLGVIPYSVLLDRQGRIVDSERGTLDAAELEQWLAAVN